MYQALSSVRALVAHGHRTRIVQRQASIRAPTQFTSKYGSGVESYGWRYAEERSQSRGQLSPYTDIGWGLHRDDRMSA